ncbi:hypothetical protein GTP81_04170 [Rugamonas sp. FT107W]|uniref:DUF600 family protein n=1 Tax=Duganella vulcania TaxID=2692166 RepID=A0A845HEF9_9BURK|nr:hypothetical protein [Duganella vulcania]MYN15939.1 hypothetical protein [Duganella vulcania]
MSIEKQTNILNRLVQIMHDSARGQYDGMSCEFEYESYENGWSVNSKYEFFRNGKSISELLDDPKDEASNFVHELHELMKTHTGGDWKSFVLNVDVAGKAHIKFSY